MAQQRILLATDPRWRVERVRSHATAPQWSPVYTAPSGRLVLPFDAAAMEFRGDDGHGAWIDALTALRVAPAQRYQLRPQAREPRCSVVVSATDGVADAPWTGDAAQRLLSPRALYRLRLHWRRLEAGLDAVDATPQLIADALAAGGLAHSEGAVGRARRCLAAEAAEGRTLSLHELAEAASSSPFHLARSFRRRTGLSPHQYRLHLRLAAALAQLDAGERDLAGLAHALGFCSQSHLGALFLREVGVTPGEARRALHAA